MEEPAGREEKLGSGGKKRRKLYLTAKGVGGMNIYFREEQAEDATILQTNHRPPFLSVRAAAAWRNSEIRAEIWEPI